MGRRQPRSCSRLKKGPRCGESRNLIDSRGGSYFHPRGILLVFCAHSSDRFVDPPFNDLYFPGVSGTARPPADTNPEVTES